MCKLSDKHCVHSMIGLTLVIIGAINMGLASLGSLININLDVLYLVFGKAPYLLDIIYILIGISAVMLIIGCKCKECCSTDGKEKAEKPGEYHESHEHHDHN